MATPLPLPPDDSGGWRISDHARERAAELGFDLLTVAQVAVDPAQTYDQPWRGPGYAVHQGGGLALGVHRPSRTVVTVLERRTDRWEHATDRRRPAPERVLARESDYAPLVELRDPEVRRRKLRRDPGLCLADARRMLAQGYGLDQVARLSGYPVEALVVEATP